MCFRVTARIAQTGRGRTYLLQVPLIEWMGGWKLLQSAVGGAAPVATRLMFRRTGSQFFLGDDGAPARRSAQPRRVRASSVSSHHVQDNGPGSVPEATPPSAGSGVPR